MPWPVEVTNEFESWYLGLAETGVTVVAGHKPWIEAKHGDAGSPESVAFREASDDALALGEIRAQRGLTQVDVARLMQTSQASVSKLERREDLYLSTLRGFVEALGGQLELAAVFPEGRITIASPGAAPAVGHAIADRPAS